MVNLVFFDKQASPWLLMHSLARRLRSDSLLRNSIYLMGSTVATSAIGYLYWVVAAHIYTVHDVGLASAFIAAMTLTSTFANMGIGSTLVQMLPHRQAGYAWSLTLNVCIAMGTLTSLLGGIVVAIALPLLSSQFTVANYHATYILIFIAGVILSTVAVLLDQTFVAERATGNMAVRNAAFALLKLPIMVLLVQVGALGILSSWVMALAASLLLVGLVLVPRLKRGYCLAMRGMTRQIQPMLSSLAGHHFINLGGTLPMYLLPVFVAVKLSATDNAYFYTTWMLGSLFFMVSSAVATALFSEGSHAASKVMRKVYASTVIIGMLLGPILLAFLLGGRYILSLFGPGYAWRGLPLLMILMVSAVPDAITNIYVSLLRVQERLRLAALLNLCMASFTLVLAWILLPVLGIAGAGWAWLIAQSVGSLIVGVDILISRSRVYWLYKGRESMRVSVLRLLTVRNSAGFCRYILLRLRFHNLRVGLFFLDRGAHMDVGPNARIRFGRGVRFMRDFTGHFYGDVTVGDGVFFNRGCYVAAYSGLTIGNHCLFGEGVSIHDENHVVGRGFEPIATRGFEVKPIVIGNNVWAGAKATILQGVHIGDNAVIGANAVVTRDVPADTIVGGIPARVLREVKESSLPVEQRNKATEAIWLKETFILPIVKLSAIGQVNREPDRNKKSPLPYGANWHSNSNGHRLKPARLQQLPQYLSDTPIIDP